MKSTIAETPRLERLTELQEKAVLDKLNELSGDSPVIYLCQYYIPPQGMEQRENDGGTETRLNPYPYQREIEQAFNFVGREDAREEIGYYLDQARGGECYNIAITGESSVGKSSLLNIIEGDAAKKDILAVNISIDRINTVSELEFFKQIYEEILSEGVEKDRIEENTLSKFREAISGVEAEGSLGFGATYLKLNKTANETSSVPRRQIVNDLKSLLQEKSDSPAISLLVDDVDIFSNKELLRKFISLISDLEGFQLVLAGTELAEVLPEDSLPLSNSFKIITVNPFSDVKQTRQCLLNPLSESEQDSFDADVSDIHSLTGGSPFEIRLIGHHMYRKYSKGGEHITLSPKILDEVAESLRNINPNSEVADRIKQLSSDYLLAVVAAVEFPGMSVDQLAECMFLYHIDDLPEDSSNVKKRWESIIERLGSTELIDENDGIEFGGTWFDQRYLKYHAVSTGVLDEDQNLSEGDPDHPYANIQQKLVTEYLLDDIGSTRGATRYDIEYDPDKPEGEKHHRLSSQFVTDVSVSADEWTVLDVYCQSRREEFYQPFEQALWFRCNINWLNHGFLTQVIFLDDEGQQREELKQRIESLDSSLNQFGYDFYLENEITWYHRGVRELQEGAAEDALGSFNRSLEFNALFGRSWDRRGVALQSLNRYIEAIVSYKMAKKLTPQLINTDVNIATIYADLGLYHKAASILKEITENDPDYSSAWLRLSRIRMDQDKWKKSLNALDSALN